METKDVCNAKHIFEDGSVVFCDLPKGHEGKHYGSIDPIFRLVNAIENRMKQLDGKEVNLLGRECECKYDGKGGLEIRSKDFPKTTSEVSK